MVRRLLLVGVFVIASAVPVAVCAQNLPDCMDCASRMVDIVTMPDGTQKIQNEALCCMWYCYGDYELTEADRGYGCAVCQFESTNSTYTGTKCCSSMADFGCRPPQPPPTETGSLEDNCSQDAGCGGSPIVLDVGDGAYQLTSLSEGVHFDLANDGMPARMAWTRGNTENAFLALDRNQNGTIDNGAELFGNFTPLRSGRFAANGFEALGEFDDNRDGVVDRSDAAWSALLLWTDRNHDGRSTPEELLPIALSGVTALETDYRWIGRRDRWGNAFRYMAHFQVGGASARRACYDVFFRME